MGTPSAFAALPMVFLMGVGLVVSLVALVTLLLALVNLAGRNWSRIVNAVARQLIPAWVEPVGTVTGLVASPALLVAVVLLLPPAKDFTGGTTGSGISRPWCFPATRSGSKMVGSWRSGATGTSAPDPADVLVEE
ncbi:hypothetical protein [Micromonospora sp. AMSO31t]|uniref:hypothetical protein n=1 Tax=Micromonospora sp. AMSO31t TaxID=2650566 RepID=UPI00124B4863|nr:hypothetical protein [Micromonospora sp. AMSO31t]KAB1907088.1 hypothetical protein F8274_24830 [Micromonospora sp. AMSO31t]